MWRKGGGVGRHAWVVGSQPLAGVPAASECGTSRASSPPQNCLPCHTHTQGLFNFKPSVRPVPLECHIQVCERSRARRSHADQ